MRSPLSPLFLFVSRTHSPRSAPLLAAPRVILKSCRRGLLSEKSPHTLSPLSHDRFPPRPSCLCSGCVRTVVIDACGCFTPPF